MESKSEGQSAPKNPSAAAEKNRKDVELMEVIDKAWAKALEALVLAYRQKYEQVVSALMEELLWFKGAYNAAGLIVTPDRLKRVDEVVEQTQKLFDQYTAPPATETPLASGAEILKSFDARDWAKHFVAHVRVHPGIPLDEDTMVTWFANALMRGFDEANRPK